MINIPINLKTIIALIENHEYEAFVVGGCVRDFFIKKEPKDWDLCTNAKPQELSAILSEYKLIEKGKKYGTIGVVSGNDLFEITTFRIEGTYKDGRRPESVTYTDNIVDDLARRDFTINGMAYNEKSGLIDPFNGLRDLKSKEIVCIGDPQKRFNEDALRILRGLRFASEFGFTIEQKTMKTMILCKKSLHLISRERIAEELFKLIKGPYSQEIIQKNRTIFCEIIVELKGSDDRWFSFLDILKTLNHEPLTLLAGLAIICNIGNYDNFFNLKLSKKQNKIIATLKKEHDKGLYPINNRVCEILSNTENSLLQSFIHLEKAFYKDGSANLFEQRLKEILYSGNCHSFADLDIDGCDLEANFNLQGQEIGTTLRKILSKVILGELENTKDSILDYIKNNMIKD